MAECYVDEGIYGAIPYEISWYLNYDAIGRDLEAGHCSAHVDGVMHVFSW